MTIEPYQTHKLEMLFYFPNEGEFQHYPTNLSEMGNVISISPVRTLKVGMKRKIKKVDTFVDMMFVAGSQQNKKDKILQLMDEDFYQLLDPNFKFNIGDLGSFFASDHSFLMKVAKRCYEKQ